MEDLISRRKALDLAKDIIVPAKDGGVYRHRCIDPDEIRELPSEQPEVIRCGECKHRFTDGENVVYNVCELNHNKVQADDWYCADAERRMDG